MRAGGRKELHELSHAMAVQDMGRSTHVWSDGYSHNKDDVADGSKSVRGEGVTLDSKRKG